ncbi:hypothetical protein BRE01_02760 [Brevibacillus reuszeri]|uniref:DUF3866 domain-containing protein n=1 Tax=Brevibacillus reuszeri TaxID=54915 RepID=A0A0K9YR94_9BACL|nr:DUF3866 family protein [Brevibacillus reuszeri]KNB71162.1 hypothetical protein ADS79_20315 [Brevibacillus reuszeri]MED1857593.1 DUF3866 family protein [Brevibacillus reuszeri]GED66574.1 hypothetical protein BRE01_02760 [Brevibacillus reuszeri]
MLRLGMAMVTGILEEQAGMRILDVQMEGSQLTEQAITFGAEEYRVGDRVLVNTTAVRLKLGTGGFHFVVGKVDPLLERDVVPNEWGHIMKMRYAPWQLTVDTVEEQSSPYHKLFLQEDLSLEGTPVVISELHSMLPITVEALLSHRPGENIVYVMPDGASLPVAFSKHVHQLRKTNKLAATVTAGHAWGGDHESVTIHSALLAAKHIEKAAVIIVMLGPGVAGTGTSYGFSGVQLAEVIHAVSVLGGISFFIPRISFSDNRSRHYGLSHHTRVVLGRYALRPVILPMPSLQGEREVLLVQQLCKLNQQNQHHIVWGQVANLTRLCELEQSYGLSFSTMGRNWREDPVPFQTAVLAADLICQFRSFQQEALIGDPYWFSLPNILAEISLFLTKSEAPL